MKKLFEDWRKHLNEETAAFHGYGMKPTQMRVAQCDTLPNDSQWEADEEGCPQFTNDKGIDLNHKDVVEAIEYIENVKPAKLIAYSRGGAMAIAALNKGVKYQPEVTFVAPAWKRGWAVGLTPPASAKGVIAHGTKDAAVPLRQSFELAQATGMPLYIFPNLKHVNILKHKNSPETGIRISDSNISLGLQTLPDWGEAKSSPEEVESQHKAAMEMTGNDAEMLQERKSDAEYVALADLLIHLIQKDGAGAVQWKSGKTVGGFGSKAFPNGKQLHNASRGKENADRLGSPGYWGEIKEPTSKKWDLPHADSVFLFCPAGAPDMDILWDLWTTISGKGKEWGARGSESIGGFVTENFLYQFVHNFRIAVYPSLGAAGGSMYHDGQMNISAVGSGLMGLQDSKAWEYPAETCKPKPFPKGAPPMNEAMAPLSTDGTIPMPDPFPGMCPPMVHQVLKWEFHLQPRQVWVAIQDIKDWGWLRTLIVHEIAHYVNAIRASGEVWRAKGGYGEIGSRKYALSTEEIQARLISQFKPMKKALTEPAPRLDGTWTRIIKLKHTLYKVQKFKDNNALRKFIKSMMRSYNEHYGEAGDLETFKDRETEGRIINRMYDFAQNLIKSHDFGKHRKEWEEVYEAEGLKPDGTIYSQEENEELGKTVPLQENKGDTCRKAKIKRKRTIRIRMNS